jgi:hypothetical protein
MFLHLLDRVVDNATVSVFDWPTRSVYTLHVVKTYLAAHCVKLLDSFDRRLRLGLVVFKV